VVVAREGKAVVLPVKRGAAEGTKVVVSGDLKEGDQVVTGPFSSVRNLKDGGAVKIETAGASTPRP
jgi:multidrug efflux pump subunit AcrA (membrane-fusion protein)